MEEKSYRLRDVVDALDHDELLKIKKDLDGGGFHIKQFIQQKIKEKEEVHEKFCPVCSSPINPKNISTYTLVFGPEDFRKKATFDALDCLKYFLQNMEQMKKKSICKKP